ncbi:MAG: radical SAM protein [Spirochaetes bacterium]|nr:radical SAM protein [Spirochaetota bacterium]
MKYLFGPIPSRRLGQSLGLDLIPNKTCTHDCVYCECGPTTNKTIQRKPYIPGNLILDELDDYLKKNKNPDYITFGGSGEPLLNSDIGFVASEIKKRHKDIKIALLTNSSLLYKKEVHQDILIFDIVLPSLDAVFDSTLIKINKPDHEIDAQTIIQGLISFRKEFTNKIWLEVFILPGINDSISELEEFKKVINEISPDRLQLNSLDRPGSINLTTPASYDRLIEIKQFFNYKNTDIITRAEINNSKRTAGKTHFDSIIETIKRRPCTINDMMAISGEKEKTIVSIINEMINQDKIIEIRNNQEVFYKFKDQESWKPSLLTPERVNSHIMKFFHQTFLIHL